MHARWQHQIPSIPMLRGRGDSCNLMLSSNLLKSKILCGGGGGGCGNLMLSSNFLNPNSYVEGGGGGVHRI